MSLKLGLRNKIRRSRAGGFTGLLDQPFATGATAAYSLRQLKSSATKAVRVREGSGNTETDIGFSGGALDETALLNHCGSANGFVTKWYDQSGNANDASNSTASEQPQIVSGGSVIQSNNEPALNFNGSTHFLQANGGLDTTKDFSVLVRLEFEKDKLERVINTNDDNNGFRIFPFTNDVRARVENSGGSSTVFYTPKPLNTSILLSITHDGDFKIFENNTFKKSVTNISFSGSDPVGPSIGAKGFQKAEFFNGKMNTVLFYNKSVENEISNFNNNI